MSTICGVCCEKCPWKGQCKGCCETNGNPFGGKCTAAQYILVGGKESFEAFKKKLIAEINNLHIEGMPEVKDLCSLAGFFVNMEYELPSGQTVKFLRDDRVYLGTQVPCVFDEERCFGIVADTDFILVCTYGENGMNHELVQYVHR